MTIDADLDRLTAQVKRHEGLRLRAYVDTVGKITIGYGRNLEDAGISTDEAEMLLAHDLDRVMRELEGRFAWFFVLDSVRQAVLVNMGFQLGMAGLSKFSQTLAAIVAKEYGQAADLMMDSKWARQVPRRAAELAAMMRTGQWPHIELPE